jgi:hypothetical protein
VRNLARRIAENGARQLCPERRVRITAQHVENALAKRRSVQISERDLVDWATMILINDAFYWEPEDAEIVAAWVNSISFDLVPENYVHKL